MMHVVMNSLVVDRSSMMDRFVVNRNTVVNTLVMNRSVMLYSMVDRDGDVRSGNVMHRTSVMDRSSNVMSWMVYDRGLVNDSSMVTVMVCRDSVVGCSSMMNSSSNVSASVGLSLRLMTRALMMWANDGGVMRVVVGRNMGIVVNAVMHGSSVVHVMVRSLLVGWSSMMDRFVMNRNTVVNTLVMNRSCMMGGLMVHGD